MHLAPRANHAQPHWHIYNENQLAIDRTLQDNSAPGEGVPIAFGEGIGQKSSEWSAPNLSRFHFAMESRWTEDGIGAHKQAFDEDNTLEWMAGCLSYIVEQLNYIDG